MTMDAAGQGSPGEAGQGAEPAVAADGVAGTALFRVLGEPSRLALLRHLLLGEHRVGELVDHLGLAQSTVSQHLAQLRLVGLLDVRPEGRASVYSVRRPEAVRAVLEAAERWERLAGAAGHDPGADR